MKKKLYCILLSLAMVVTMMPMMSMPALAGTLPWEGAGTEASPYLIKNAEQLNAFFDEVSKGNTFESKFFKLDADIGSSSTALTKYAKGEFKGTFDGNGYTVWLNINETSNSKVGMFSTNKGTIKNLIVEGSVQVNFSTTDGVSVGSVTGTNEQVVDRCVSHCNVTVTNTTDNVYVGAITGYNNGAQITNCMSDGNIQGTAKYVRIGGIAGVSRYSTAKIENSYSLCSLNGEGNANCQVGGIVAILQDSSTVANCYYAGTSLIGTKASSILIGTICGNNPTGSIGASYYPQELNCGATGSGASDATGLTTAQMKGASGTENALVDKLNNYKKDGNYPEEWDTWIQENANEYPVFSKEPPLPRKYDAEGKGTQSEPYLISNAYQLNDFFTKASSDSFNGKYFKLTEDIGSDSNRLTQNATKEFKGTFDGNGKTVWLNLSEAPGSNNIYLGMFDKSTGTIKNLTVDAKINETVSTTKDVFVAGIVADNFGTINGCTVNCDIEVKNEQNSFDSSAVYIGAIVAQNQGTITNCMAKGTISGNGTNAPYIRIGGIAGYNGRLGNQTFRGGAIKNSYSLCSLTGETTKMTCRVAGIASTNYDASIENCYYAGASLTATAPEENKSVGAIVASNSENGTIKAVYYPTELGISTFSSNNASVTGDLALTQAQMQGAPGTTDALIDKLNGYQDNSGVYPAGWAAWEQKSTGAYPSLAPLISIINETPESAKATNNGYISLASETYKGAKVLVSVTPNPGYKLDTLKYNDGTDHTITANEQGKYEFTMPDKEVKVTATFIESVDWSSLKKVLSGDEDGSIAGVFEVDDTTISGTRIVKLLADIQVDNSNAALVIPAGKNVIIDLNGFTLNRGLTGETAIQDGRSFAVAGNLTIRDSSQAGSGKVTGGNTTEHGGAVYVSAGGKFTLESGSLSGNKAAGGGAVLVESGATFVMTGGAISGNTAASEGAGVYCQGSFTITGGEISGNTAGNIGGGICCIKDSDITVGGKAKISSNTANGATNNVYLCTDAVISIGEAFSNPAAIGVTAQSPFATITDNHVNSADAAFFSSDNAFYTVFFNTNHLELVENTETWTALQGKINDASAPITIKLNKNLTAANGDSPLFIPQGKTVTIDLNGFTIDRGLKEAEAVANGNVITVNGTLTVKDSSNPSTGKITGGNSSNLRSGGVVVDQGTFTLESGSICDNKSAQNGGGVLVLPGRSFTMNGGKITGNTSSNGGGGVFCQGNFTFVNGEISDNTAKSGAGVYVYAKDDTKHTITNHFIMQGGKIINNEASDKGGGVYADNYDIDTQLLGGEITGNKAGNIGGGIATNMSMTVGGKVLVKNNTVNSTASNIYLRNVSKKDYTPAIIISVANPLEEGTEIFVTLESGAGTIATNVTSDLSEYFYLDSDGTSHPSYVENASKLAVTTAVVTTENELNKVITGAGSDIELTIKLGTDITLNNKIEIASNKKICLDLNGHTLDRGLSQSAASDNGNVIVNNGTLTIKDSSDTKTGTITGGNASYGGAITSYGKTTLESGIITGCKAISTDYDKSYSKLGRGGAIYVPKNGTFTMTGGEIRECSASVAGGAVFVVGTMSMSGGNITNCNVSGVLDGDIVKAKGGAVYLYGDSEFKMLGGEISNNTLENVDDTRGAGLYVAENANATLGGTAKIISNKINDPDAKSDIYSNMFLYDNVFINIATEEEAPATGMEVGVTTKTAPTGKEPVIFANNCTTDVSKYFKSDSKNAKIVFSKEDSVLQAAYKTGGGAITEPESQVITEGDTTNADVRESVEVTKNEDGKSEAAVDISKIAEDIVKTAMQEQAKAVIIDAAVDTQETVNKAGVNIPVDFLEGLLNIDSFEELVIQTNVCEFGFDRTAIQEIANQASDATMITVEAIRQDEESQTLSQDVYELKVVANTRSGQYIIGDFKGGKVNVTVDIPEGLTGKKLACLYRSDEGVYVRRVITTQNDLQGWFKFETNHFSSYVVAEAAVATKLLVNQTSVTQNKLKSTNKKQVKVSIKKATWDKELGKKVVSYQVYRSTKANKGFKRIATLKNQKKSTITYVNKKYLKSGKKYYYKVRGMVKLANGKYVYTKWSTVRSIKCL